MNWQKRGSRGASGQGLFNLDRDLLLNPDRPLDPKLGRSDTWGLQSIFYCDSHNRGHLKPSLSGSLVFLTNKQTECARVVFVMHIKYSTNCLALLNFEAVFNRLFVLDGAGQHR